MIVGPEGDVRPSSKGTTAPSALPTNARAAAWERRPRVAPAISSSPRRMPLRSAPSTSSGANSRLLIELRLRLPWHYRQRAGAGMRPHHRWLGHAAAAPQADAQGAAVMSDALTPPPAAAIKTAEHFPAGLEVRRRLARSTETVLKVRPGRPMRALRGFAVGGAEPTQLHAFAASQSGCDLVEYRRNDQFSVHPPQLGAAGGEFRDEICPGHRRLPRGSFSTQSRHRGVSLFTGAANQ